MSRAFDILIEVLRDGERTDQAEAARLLGEARVKQAVTPLLDYVDGCQQFHKSAGFTALGRIGDTSVCDKIHELIDDPRMRDDWYWFGWKSVRAAMAHALLLLGDARGLEFMNELADKQDDMFYAWFAPAVLRLTGEVAGVKELQAKLTVESLFDVGERSTRLSDPGRLTPVIEALGEISGDAAHTKIKEFTDHRSRYVRGQAAVSLMKAAANGECKEIVAGMYDSDETDFVKAKAALALKDAEKLAKLAQSAKCPFEKAVAIEGLGLIAAKDQAGLVASMSDDKDGYVRQCVIEALERMEADEAVSVAEKAMLDDVVGVKIQAAKSLVVLQGI